MFGDIAFRDHVANSLGDSNMKINGEKTVKGGHWMLCASLRIVAGVVIEITIFKVGSHSTQTRVCGVLSARMQAPMTFVLHPHAIEV